MMKGIKTCCKTAFFILLIASSASAQWSGERLFAYMGNWPDNYTIQVSIFVTGTSNEAITITDTPPEGWTIDAKTSKGVVVDGTVSWTGSEFKKALTYKVTPLENATGTVFFSGKIGTREITGSKSLTLGQVEPGVQTPIDSGLYYRYLLYLPKTYQSNQPMPLILHLHTWSERGTSLESVRNFGIAKILNNPISLYELYNDLEFPFILVSPQCPSNNDTWRTNELFSLLEEIFARYSIDRDRVYMTGNSFGGSATWDLACSHPELFAAIAPISGGNPSQSQLEKLVDEVSVWSFHNKNDSVTSSSGQIKAIQTLQNLGGDAQITLYEGTTAHDAWTQTYSNPEFYDWLLQHTKNPSQTAIHQWMLQK